MTLNNLCKTCGTEYPQADDSPNACPICDDDRQYLPEDGQQWTNYDELRTGHKIVITALTPILYALKIEPAFALGQRALLMLSEQGNVLWDCIPLLDEAVIDFIRSKGGLKAIAFSHPHYYSTMNRWAEVLIALFISIIWMSNGYLTRATIPNFGRARKSLCGMV